jgi:hypothetical protein
MSASDSLAGPISIIGEKGYHGSSVTMWGGKRMKIDVSDSAEFKRLLEALVNELIDAHDHFRLHQDLDAAIPDYQAEFNQSAGFWTFTLSAHMDATLLRL